MQKPSVEKYQWSLPIFIRVSIKSYTILKPERFKHSDYNRREKGIFIAIVKFHFFGPKIQPPFTSDTEITHCIQRLNTSILNFIAFMYPFKNAFLG